MAHLLDGCHKKLDRAEENIRNLNDEISAFIGQDTRPYKVVGKYQNDGRKYALVIEGDPAPPLRFAVLAGEIIHHLRSTLDHLVWALVLAHNEVPGRVAFPICIKLQQFENACDSGLIKGVSRSAKKKIREVQPYLTAAPQDSILTILREFDDTDKHSLLVVVTTVIRLHQQIYMGGTFTTQPGVEMDIFTFQPPVPKTVMKDGDEIWGVMLGVPHTKMDINAECAAQVAFDKCGSFRNLEVIRFLNQAMTLLRGLLVFFSGEF